MESMHALSLISLKSHLRGLAALKQCAASVFIILSLYMIIGSLWPPFTAAYPISRFPLVNPIRNVLIFLGLEQDFRAFSDPPKVVNPQIGGCIMLSDGTFIRKWIIVPSCFFWEQTMFEMCKYPYMRSAVPDRPLRIPGRDKPLWKGLARYFAGRNYSEQRRPVVVWLGARWDVPPAPGSNVEESRARRCKVVFRYKLTMEDLASIQKDYSASDRQ